MHIKKTVYFVRHGQSVDNASPVFQAYGSPLNDRGRLQAADIAGRARHLEFETIIASPQNRAHETAMAIADASGKAIEVSDLFIERFKPSSVSGKPHSDMVASGLFRKWDKSLVTPGMRIEDGENYDDILQRADQALEFLRDRPEDKLLVVSHGHFMLTMVARVLLGEAITGAALKRFYQHASIENTALTVLNYADSFEQDYAWRLWTLNDHSHFAV